MEFENVLYDFQSSYIDQYQHCSYESAFSLQANHSVVPYSPQDVLSEDADIENYLLMEQDCGMDLDFIHHDGTLGLEKVQEGELSPDREGEGHAEALSPEDPQLKEIQEELMEESSLTDLLVMGAEAVETGNWDLASVILLRLNGLLSDHENGDTPIDRLALYFIQGLLCKSLNASEIKEHPVSESMSAFQMLQEISPYVKFAHFTANQAILEATGNNQEIHVIDFDIMEGSQWPPLMVDLADRENASLRITAIVSDKRNLAQVQQTGRRLQEFAESISLIFMFDLILLTKEDDLMQLQGGDVLIANCMVHQVHMPHRGNTLIRTFFSGLRKLSSTLKMVVLVEEDLFNFAKILSMSFVEFFCEALHHYTALSDSILSGFCGEYKLALRVIEKEFLGMRILESLEKFPCEERERQMWRDGNLSLYGFRPIPMSSCNVSQAKYLVSLFNGAYWVQNEHCKLALCWKTRPLTTASIWVPTSSHSLVRSTLL